MESKLQSFKGKDFKVIKGETHPDYSYYTFESEESNFRNKYWNIKKDDVVFDVGSSYGSYALTACAMDAKVYAFEPEPMVFFGLVNNILINNWQNICYPFNFGLYNSETSVNMKEYAPHWPEYCISQDYKVKTLDSIIKEKQITKLDWIKIDVEGVEEQVIYGGLKSIERFKPKMIIECHNFLNPNISKNIKEILSVFGYQFEEIIRDPCVMLYASLRE